MKLGLSSYTYVWAIGIPGYPQPTTPLTPLQILEKTEQQKVRLVQIGDNLPIDTLTQSELEEFKSRADSADIEIEVATSGINIANLRRHIQIAQYLDAKIIRTLLDSLGHQPDADESVKTLATITGELAETGVTLAIENHDRFKAAELAGIIERINSPFVGVCLDTANSLSCLETPRTVVETLAPHTVNLHVKDFRFRRPGHLKGFVVEGCAVGQGQLDVPWLLKEIQNANPTCNAVIELWPPEQTHIDDAIRLENQWAELSVQYLRQFITS